MQRALHFIRPLLPVQAPLGAGTRAQPSIGPMKLCRNVLVFFSLVGAALRAQAAPPLDAWKPLGVGVTYRAFDLDAPDAPDHDRLHVVRIEPAQVEWRVGLAAESGGPQQTAQAWANGLGVVAAINAGMYQEDHRRNVGYLRHGKHLNNPSWKKAYASAFAFGPRKKGLPAATMVDLDAPGATEQLANYQTVIQNLRLIKAPGVGVWKRSGRRWSEAAVALDDQGRVLFLFSRAPFEMEDLARKLLALPLGIVRAMHVEGGPEASLSVHARQLTLDLSGSYETGFFMRDDNAGQWKLPNVIGVRVRAP